MTSTTWPVVGERRVDFREAADLMSPWIMCNVSGYLEERSESFEGVRARTLT